MVVGSKIKAILPSIWPVLGQKEREGTMENEPKDKQSQKGMIVSGLIILGMGVLFLANEMGWIPGLHRTWPLILIVVGLALILGAVFKKPSGTPGQ